MDDYGRIIDRVDWEISYLENDENDDTECDGNETKEDKSYPYLMDQLQMLIDEGVMTQATLEKVQSILGNLGIELLDAYYKVIEWLRKQENGEEV